MEPMYLPPIAQRSIRVKTAIELGTPDRVPFIPMLGNIYCLDYGVTMKDGMSDYNNVIPAIDRLLKDCEPDVLNNPPIFPLKAMERLDAQYFGWPGKKPEYDDNFIYQMYDGCFLEEDQYDEFLRDPSRYLLQKVLPKKYPALAGLAFLDPYALCTTNVMGFAGLGIPPAQAAFQALAEAGGIVGQHAGLMGAGAMHAVELGFPMFGSSTVMSPFDDFADSIRGLVNTVTDLITCPELLAEAVDRYADVTIPSGIALAKMTHQQYIFIPLHCGVDEFMSPENYEKYYWPPLKKLINAVIAADLTPLIFCEGNYKTRLDILQDVPKGKVIYFFEKQDMKLAKEKLSGIACIGGNMSAEMLAHGTKEQIVEETKRLLDMLAPGGGYVMSNDIILDHCAEGNLNAWYEATLKYGTY